MSVVAEGKAQRAVGTLPISNLPERNIGADFTYRHLTTMGLIRLLANNPQLGLANPLFLFG